MVEVTLGQLVERLDGLLERHRRARLTGELLGRHHVLAQEALDAARTLDQLLVLLGQLVDTEDRDDVLQILVALQDSDDFLRDAVVLVADHRRVQDGRGRRQRVHGREDALREHCAGELGGGVEVRERRRRRRVGVVVGGHVHGLHRGDRLTPGGGDALLQLAHLVGQRGLVTHGGRHTAEQRRHLGTRLGEPEDVVDEQQHVLALLVTEELGHRQRRQGHAHTRARRLVHLTEHQRGVLEHVRVFELDPEVVALAGALTHAGEHRRTTEVAGDAVDHLLDEHRLAHAGTAEQRDLATAHVRGQKVDDLQTGLQHLRAGFQLGEGGRLAVDRPVIEVLAVARLVEAVTESVEHVALDAVTDGHRDRGPRVGHLDPTDQSVGGLHRDGAHQVVAEVLGDLQGQGLGQLLVGDVGVQRVEQLRHGAARELDVDDRAGDANHATRGLFGFCGCSHFLFASLRAVLLKVIWRRPARWRRRRSR